MKRFLCAVVAATCLYCSQLTLAADYTLAINHGRVIDPESGLDAVRHLGIIDDGIATISETPLNGDTVIDASDLVVAPGFIDLHTHSPTPLGQYYQAFDGVTTALELEMGHHPVLKYAGQIQDRAMINYGASASYISARTLVKNGISLADSLSDPKPVGVRGWMTVAMIYLTDFNTALAPSLTEPADAAQLARLRSMLIADLDAGALGIGLALDYQSEGIRESEMDMIFGLAAQRRVPVYVHIRRGIDGDPAGLHEVIALARQHKTSVHICHITHNAISNLDYFLAQIRDARAEGIDITTEVLPYNAGSALISSAVFNRDWQTTFNITYEDVEWAATGERFDQAMWEEYRANYPEGQVIHHYLNEAWTRQAVQEPGVIIVSDLLPMESKDKKVAPHNGAFSKILARYVREEQLLDLNTAIGKMTLLPARRLEAFAPAFRRKGRVQVGMDADLTLFNPSTILDNATYQAPFQAASGIKYVIVNGQAIIHEGKPVTGVYPGRRLLAESTR